MQGSATPVRSRVSQLLLIGALLSGSSCDTLWSAHLKNDPDNCVQDPSVCDVNQGLVCNQRTEICEPGITLTAVTPPLGPSTGGVPVTLTGSAFVDGMTVTFDGVQASGLSLLSASSLQVLLPARPGVRGKVPVSISLPPDQLAVRNDLFAYYPGNLVFAPPANIGTVSGPQTLAAADLNKDGVIDLVMAGYGSNAVGVQLGKGDGTFTANAAVVVGAAPIGVTLGDLNGDGFPDIIASDYGSSGVSVALGNGDGTFQKSAFTATGGGATWATAKDADGDGFLDVAVANAGANTVTILYGNGDGTFATPLVNIGLSGNATWLDFGEFGSGTGADLAIAYDNVAKCDIYTRSSARSYSPAGAQTVGAVARSVVAGDFNHDGRSDLAVANYGASSVSVILNSSGGLQPAVNYPIGTGPYSVNEGDVNGDGYLDLVTGDPQGNDVAVLIGKGDGTFEDAVRKSAGANTRHAVIADFNGDGLGDIAAANFNASTFSVLLNQSQ